MPANDDVKEIVYTGAIVSNYIVICTDELKEDIISIGRCIFWLVLEKLGLVNRLLHC